MICIHRRNTTQPQKETTEIHSNMVASVKNAKEFTVSPTPLNGVLEPAQSSQDKSEQ